MGPAHATTPRLSAAAELHSRGVAEYNRGHPRRAGRLFERARRALDGDDAARHGDEGRRLDAALWISEALIAAEIHGAEAALAALAEARTRAEAVDDRRLIVRVHSQAGAIAMRIGRFDDALEEYACAEAVLDRADDNDHFAVLLNSGYVHLIRNDLGPARRFLSRAADFATATGMADERFKAMHNLGYLEYLAGDLPAALRLMEDAWTDGVTVSPGVALIDRARVLTASGLVREADEVLAEAARIFRRERLAQDLAEVYLSRAECALLGGDLRTARRLSAVARDRFRRRGNDHWRRRSELVLLEGDLAAGRPATRLHGPAERLGLEFAAEGLRGHARTAALLAAEAHLRQRDVASAEQVMSGLGIARGEPVPLRLHARYVAGRLALASGDRRRAAREARGGLAELAEYQARFGSIDLQTAAAVHGRRLGQLDLEIALDSARPDQVFAAAERARAVSARLPAVRPPDDPVAAELLAELRQVVEALRPVEQDPQAAAPLADRRRRLEREIAHRRWTLAGSGETVRAASLSAVRPALDAAQSTMVSYLQVGGRLHAVVVGGPRTRLCDLGSSAEVVEQVRRVRADLDVLAYPRLPAPLVGAVRSSLTRSLDRLDALLLAPLRLDGRRLVISSTGLLGQLPWGALPSLRGVPVAVAPSATAWLTAATAGPDPGGEVVALAGPDLERAGHEVAGIAAAHRGAAALRGAAADCEALTGALAKARIVHVAAHGVHQTENPLFSCVRLADGVLFAHELDRTARTPQHVVLSACELGLATVRPGDEALGLTSVLLHLGTRSVVAGVARVGDELAETTMIDYHRRLASGLDSAAALAGALAAGPELAAPFVCFGSAWTDTHAVPAPGGGARDLERPGRLA